MVLVVSLDRSTPAPNASVRSTSGRRSRAQLSDWPDIVTVSPTVTPPPLRSGRRQPVDQHLTGIDPEVYFQIVRVPDYIVAGQPRVLTEDILIGTELAKDLGPDARRQDQCHRGDGFVAAFTVAGIFDLGNKGANMRTTFVALRTAQALSKLVGGVTSIDLTVTDIYAAETSRKR